MLAVGRRPCCWPLFRVFCESSYSSRIEAMADISTNFRCLTSHWPNFKAVGKTARMKNTALRRHDLTASLVSYHNAHRYAFSSVHSPKLRRRTWNFIYQKNIRRRISERDVNLSYYAFYNGNLQFRVHNTGRRPRRIRWRIMWSRDMQAPYFGTRGRSCTKGQRHRRQLDMPRF